jgi:dGTPase
MGHLSRTVNEYMDINFNTKIKATRPYDLNIPLSKQFESDRGRIINSAAIRRLQQKTQVFPLERNAAVRSRLTHSLEVQQVGRYISQLISEELAKRANENADFGLTALARDLETIVEMSCLMHDVGNPPFGHFGEAALIDWLENNITSIYSGVYHKALPDEVARDLIHFEGNAQGLRLIHSLLQLNLTYTQASGIMKYTRCGKDPKPSKDDDFSYLKKKVGFYLSESDYILKLRQALQIDEHCRSPFSYIMEAADDISYGIADLEDAVEKGVLSLEQMKHALAKKFNKLAAHLSLPEQETMDKMLDTASKRGRESVSMFFVFLRVEVNARLPKHAQKAFIDNIEAVYNGSFNRALIEDGSVNHVIVETFKLVALEEAFCDPEVQARELQGYRVLHGLMECYKPLLMLSKEQFDVLMFDLDDKSISMSVYVKRLFKKLSSKHKVAYKASMKDQQLSTIIADADCREFYFRTRLIIDYVSGMTDQFAFDEYRAFHVIDEF